MRCLPLLALLLALAPLAAGEVRSPKIRGAEELEEAERLDRRTQAFLREAAEYRLARVTATPDPRAEEEVRAALARARAMREHGGRAWYHLWLISRYTRARWLAEDAYDAHPYAPNIGEVFHFALECRAANREVRGTLNELERLWHWLPDYPRMGEAMRTALAMAEDLQDFATKLDLDAEDPRAVVRLEGKSFVYDLDDLFRFLAEHGDRDEIAPRAQLGLARSLLLSGEREDRWRARRAYEEFLARFPDHPLLFTAIFEQALSHLVAYKGDAYDAGALRDAAELVDLAELEVRGDPERQEQVSRLRRRLTVWQQQRDLTVARWYAARTRPRWLAWLKRPPELADPDAGARYYAAAVIRRDRASRPAAEAEALQQQLPPAEDR
ncbi:MAG: hypothetical protein RMM29_08275 [Planctomycetota bacterium]|nr:hypothetical protein [Planctomycetota bacterium]MCX8039208.1 hypothetical protein [Planctomycetota bacterium]MDW8373623.1 hypothetical protein [Planctomycetota bacterium]